MPRLSPVQLYPDTLHHVRDAALAQFMSELIELRIPDVIEEAFVAGWNASRAAHAASVIEDVRR